MHSATLTELSYKPLLMAKRLKDIWDNWGVELLMAVSCSIHMVLTLFGSSRRRMTAHQVLGRVLVWSSYNLANSVAIHILGKLFITRITSKSINDAELRGFLAPLLLVQLWSHDAITAYTIDDITLGVRQFPILFDHMGAVFLILLNTWNSLVSYLYLPLFLAGAIKGGENACAMSKALKGSSGITPSQFEQEARTAASILDIRNKIKDHKHFNSLQMITTAYLCFIYRKPHIQNWINMYPPESTINSFVDHLDYGQVFQIIDFELGFMYDVLYTKFPLVYTRFGLALRLTSLLSLISCSIAFACFFKDSFVYYENVGFTLVILAVIVTLEFYQIYMLFFSEWAIIMIIKHSNNLNKSWLLNFLAPRSVKWKRWSNTLEQFSFINYCIKYDKICCKAILKFKDMDIKIQKYFCTTSLDVTDELKQLLFAEMKKLDIWTRSRPVSERDDGAEEWCGVIVSFGVDEFKCSVKRRVLEQSIISDMSIIVWHIATEICYQHDHKDSPNPKRKMKMGRYLSNYMMYIMAVLPQMLSISTSEIVFEDTCDYLVAFIKSKKQSSSKERMDEKAVCSALQDFEEGSETMEKKQGEVTEEGKESKKTKQPKKLTHDWHILKEAKELSEKLLNLGDRRWEVICRVWVDMLCSAAYNCKPDQHSEQLRRGGEILTHVWIILLHHEDASLPQHDASLSQHIP